MLSTCFLNLFFFFLSEGKESFSRSLSAPVSPVSSLELSHSSTQFPDFGDESPTRDTPSPRLTRPLSREAAVQTPELSPEPAPEVKDEIVVVQVKQDFAELERTQSSKSLATSSTSSGGDNEKQNSIHSAHSFENVNGSREGVSKRYSVSSMSKEEAILSGSDGELNDKRKVKKSKSFLQKHGDKIKSKLSFRKKGKPKVEERGRTPTKIMSCINHDLLVSLGLIYTNVQHPTFQYIGFLSAFHVSIILPFHVMKPCMEYIREHTCIVLLPLSL